MYNTAPAAISWLLELSFLVWNKLLSLLSLIDPVIPFMCLKRVECSLANQATPSFIRVTFLLRCMDLEMGPDSGCVSATAKLSHRYKSHKLLGVVFPQIGVRTRFEVMSGRQRSV